MTSQAESSAPAPAAETPVADTTFRRARKPVPPTIAADEAPVQTETAPKEKAKRGRKIKYSSEEDRVDARRKQQREYRQRKKEELINLRKLVKETPPQPKPADTTV